MSGRAVPDALEAGPPRPQSIELAAQMLVQESVRGTEEAAVLLDELPDGLGDVQVHCDLEPLERHARAYRVHIAQTADALTAPAPSQYRAGSIAGTPSLSLKAQEPLLDQAAQLGHGRVTSKSAW